MDIEANTCKLNMIGTKV